MNTKVEYQLTAFFKKHDISQIDFCREYQISNETLKNYKRPNKNTSTLKYPVELIIGLADKIKATTDEVISELIYLESVFELNKQVNLELLDGGDEMKSNTYERSYDEGKKLAYLIQKFKITHINNLVYKLRGALKREAFKEIRETILVLYAQTNEKIPDFFYNIENDQENFKNEMYAFIMGLMNIKQDKKEHQFFQLNDQKGQSRDEKLLNAIKKALVDKFGQAKTSQYMDSDDNQLKDMLLHISEKTIEDTDYVIASISKMNEDNKILETIQLHDFQDEITVFIQLGFNR
ncbi:MULTISPECIES: hypothetical protein [Listeria]|uniref:hypothetical protein n=1 Tax=Listeria TaxID=1637 RepID=UPI000B59338A|nr:MULTISPECIES: hypothetical protein [Listeria]